MTATYTVDVFSSLDGHGGVNGGDWGGYWGKQGPELLDHRRVSEQHVSSHADASCSDDPSA